jgi:CelD/BcsL family acetyltransferase involved in cellulose biosynthesis
MQVCEFSNLDELAPYAEQWDRLAGGVPLRTWSWLSRWWKHYGLAGGGRRGESRLLVLGVFDHADMLVGVAPWHLLSSASGGRVIRWLGSGEVCSDYLSVLCHPAVEEQVVESLADYLAESGTAATSAGPAWDLLELDGVDAEDRLVETLVRRLAEHGNKVHVRPGPSCWRVELPPTWDQYLAALSKSHRKQLRRLEGSLLDTGRAVLHTVERLEDLSSAADLLVDLHQRRQRSLGQPGSFASARFAAFHREVMPALLRDGHLQLHRLELDGRTIAAEYHLAGNRLIYAYQSGVEPQSLADEPGRLITLATLRRAIGQGFRAMDFLRGDEPYKAHFRAARRPMRVFRVVANHPAARLRHNIWLAGANVKQWIKGGPLVPGPWPLVPGRCPLT